MGLERWGEAANSFSALLRETQEAQCLEGSWPSSSLEINRLGIPHAHSMVFLSPATGTQDLSRH